MSRNPYAHQPRGPRALTLTDKGRAAINVRRGRAVPLLRLPWRPDHKDRTDREGPDDRPRP